MFADTHAASLPAGFVIARMRAWLGPLWKSAVLVRPDGEIIYDPAAKPGIRKRKPNTVGTDQGRP